MVRPVFRDERALAAGFAGAAFNHLLVFVTNSGTWRVFLKKHSKYQLNRMFLPEVALTARGGLDRSRKLLSDQNGNVF
jgi:uncharacterized protein YfaQ (DUF2300 family)